MASSDQLLKVDDSTPAVSKDIERGMQALSIIDPAAEESPPASCVQRAQTFWAGFTKKQKVYVASSSTIVVVIAMLCIVYHRMTATPPCPDGFMVAPSSSGRRLMNEGQKGQQKMCVPNKQTVLVKAPQVLLSGENSQADHFLSPSMGGKQSDSDSDSDKTPKAAYMYTDSPLGLIDQQPQAPNVQQPIVHSPKMEFGGLISEAPKAGYLPGIGTDSPISPFVPIIQEPQDNGISALGSLNQQQQAAGVNNNNLGTPSQVALLSAPPGGLAGQVNDFESDETPQDARYHPSAFSSGSSGEQAAGVNNNMAHSSAGSQAYIHTNSLMSLESQQQQVQSFVGENFQTQHVQPPKIQGLNFKDALEDAEGVPLTNQANPNDVNGFFDLRRNALPQAQSLGQQHVQAPSRSVTDQSMTVFNEKYPTMPTRVINTNPASERFINTESVEEYEEEKDDRH